MVILTDLYRTPAEEKYERELALRRYRPIIYYPLQEILDDDGVLEKTVCTFVIEPPRIRRIQLRSTCQRTY